MSKLTDYLRKPYSVAVDAAISALVGGAALVLFQVVPNILPFQGAIETGLAGVIGAMFYMRARDNLNNQTGV